MLAPVSKLRLGEDRSIGVGNKGGGELDVCERCLLHFLCKEDLTRGNLFH